MDKKYIVYLHISPSWHAYVGITCTKPVARWGTKGQGYKDNPKFWNAIKKYKWKNFQHIIMARNLSFEEARALESYLVRTLGTYEDGYNCTNDGGGTAGSKEMIEATIKRNKSRVKAVHQFSLDGAYIMSFVSAREANAITGVSYKHISVCCCGRRQMAGGFLWSFESDGPTFEIDRNKIRNNNVKILQYDPHTLELLKVYNNLAEASQVSGIAKPNICGACRGAKSYYANGYYWKYEGDETPLRHRARTRSKSVRCIETGIIFSTVEEAARFAGTCATTITNKCRSGQSTTNGYHFTFEDDLMT